MPGAACENGEPSEAEVARIRALYFGEVTLVDRWVGRLLEQVDALGLRDDTLVVVVSDHGTQVLDHGAFGKGPNRLHAYNTRINWILRHPEIAGEHHVPGFVQSHDLAPTLLRLLEIPGSAFDGVDVWPLVGGRVEAVRDHVVIGWAGFGSGSAQGRASVRDDRWNYTVTPSDPAQQEELFDLVADPDEQVNVVAGHAEVIARQRQRLEAVLLQPLPARMEEVCDHPVPAPLIEYLHRRGPGAYPDGGER